MEHALLPVVEIATNHPKKEVTGSLLLRTVMFSNIRNCDCDEKNNIMTNLTFTTFEGM